jgi:hypothetical protein
LPQSGQVKLVQCSLVEPSAASSNACWISPTDSAVILASCGRTSAGLIALPLVITGTVSTSSGVSSRGTRRRG